MINNEPTAIHRLVNIVSQRQVNSKSINQALELICSGFYFETALIYELDFFEYFSVSEHFSLTNHNVEYPQIKDKSTIAINEEILSGETLYISKALNNTELEKYLLTVFNAESLALKPIVEEAELLGFFVFLRGSGQNFGNIQEDLALLEMALSLLVRYLEVRFYKKKLLKSQQILKTILDNTGIDIYVNDFYSHEILYANRSMAEPYGGVENLVGHKCWQALFPGQTGPCEFCPQVHLLDENGKPSTVYTWDYQRRFDGSWFRVFSTAFYWVDGRLAHAVSSADITENKRNEALIEYMANYDELTGLPNRRMLINECRHRISKATPNERGYILFFDIDEFKKVNDTLGHDAGDELLIQIAKFFAEIPLLQNAIFRNGGDEFVAVLGGEAIYKDNIISLSALIRERFKKPWALQKGNVFCGTSIGVACFPEDGLTAEDLLNKADMAMYRVKKKGGNAMSFAQSDSAEQ